MHLNNDGQLKLAAVYAAMVRPGTFIMCPWFSENRNCDGVRRGHPKWSFSKGIPQNAVNSGLGIIVICRGDTFPGGQRPLIQWSSRKDHGFCGDLESSTIPGYHSFNGRLDLHGYCCTKRNPVHQWRYKQK